MLEIVLVRHGETDWNLGEVFRGRADVDLNEKGMRQAELLGEYLSRDPIDFVYSSPLQRAVKTAEAVAAHHNLEVNQISNLIDFDFGEWQDKTLKQLRRRKLWKVVQGNPSRMRFPGGETFARAQGRIVQELETLAGEHRPKELIACFSHSDLIKLALGYYLGQPLDLFQRIMIAPASVSTLHLGEMGAQVINVNHSAENLHFPHHKPEGKSKS